MWYSLLIHHIQWSEEDEVPKGWISFASEHGNGGWISSLVVLFLGLMSGSIITPMIPLIVCWITRSRLYYNTEVSRSSGYSASSSFVDSGSSTWRRCIQHWLIGFRYYLCLLNTDFQMQPLKAELARIRVSLMWCALRTRMLPCCWSRGL
ncbi:hypothetical protein EDD85DRAFT_331233 [Armillaria nabsnona]|nr:hypothetical protein EDD85DRAFT_331233 [Armillaria nabsnona]